MTPLQLLWLSKETPDPLGQGGQRRQFFQIRELSRAGVVVTVLTPAGPQSDTSVSDLARVIRFGRRRWTGRQSPDPLEMARTGNYDRMVIAHAESFDLLRGAHADLQLPWLVDFHNVNTRWYSQIGNPDQAEYWRPIEQAILARASICLTCSAAERESLLDMAAAADVRTAPNGVDPPAWPASAILGSPDPTVGVFGSWWYPPNRDGLSWFLKRVWPSVVAAAPTATLLVAGSGVPPVEDTPAGSVRYVGRVDDLARFLGSVRAVAVPVLSGPGTPVKFSEALVSGAAVVATADAAGGHPDAPALMSNEPLDFVDALVSVLTDRVRAEALGAACRTYALEQCTWAACQRPLVDWATGPTQALESQG